MSYIKSRLYELYRTHLKGENTMNHHNEHTLESENESEKKLELLGLLLLENAQLKKRVEKLEKRLKDDEEMIDTLAIEMERMNNE